MIKICPIFLMLVSTFLSGHSLPLRNVKDSALVIIQLDNCTNHNQPIDSVYLIFDRYDRTGAGIIKQVYHPVNNRLEIVVPRGKYYMDLFCLGNYNDKHFDRILKAKPRRQNKVLLKLEESSFYTPGLVSIPPEKIDFSNLSVTSSHFFK